jgi:hypothetical protein
MAERGGSGCKPWLNLNKRAEQCQHEYNAVCKNIDRTAKWQRALSCNLGKSYTSHKNSGAASIFHVAGYTDKKSDWPRPEKDLCKRTVTPRMNQKGQLQYSVSHGKI